MRMFFCDCCGRDITDKEDRYAVALYNRAERKTQTILHLCNNDMKKVRNLKLVPMSNVRVRKIPSFYNVVENYQGKQISLFILPEWNITQLESLNKADRTKLRTKNGDIYYTKEYVISRVDGSFKPELAVHKLIEWTQLLFNQQTQDEKKSYETKHHNNRGFNKSDAKFMSAMARIAFDKGEEALSEKQLAVMRYKFIKYAEQVANLLNEQNEP